MKLGQVRGSVYALGCEYGDLVSPSARRRTRFSPALVRGGWISMMTRRGRFSLLATVTAVAIAMGGCANDGSDPSPDPSSSPNSSAPTTSTPTPPSDTEVASEAASAVLRNYYDVRNQLRQDPSKPLRLLDEVAISTELSAQRNLFNQERKQGLRQVGDTKVAVLEVQSVNLDNSDPKAGRVPTVQIDLCFDVSDVDIVDADGESIIAPDRPDTGWIQFLVSNYEWETDPENSWRVASSEDIERKPCDVS